jgi:hypothetical protein
MKGGSFSLDSFYSKLDWIFPIYFGVYFIEFYFGLWGITVGVKFLCILLSFLFAFKILSSTDKGMGARGVFTIFFAYYVLTGAFYAFNSVSIRCYLNEVFNSIPAMFFFYVGLGEKRSGDQFYDKFLKSCTICMLIGIALYVTTPGWYVSRRIEIADNTSWSGTTHNEDSLLSTMRFSSYLIEGYEADMFAMVALAIALFSFFKKNYTGKTWIGLSFIIINYVAAVLTQQRVAMAAATFAVFFYMIYGSIHKREKQSRKLLLTMSSLLVVGAVLVFLYLGDRAEQLILLLTDRLDNMNVSTALSERNYQMEIFDSWTMPITGLGAGSGGAIAGSFGLPHVNDAGYLQMLYETGIIGTLLFIIIICPTLLRGAKHMKVYLAELVIIMFVLVAMIGSNTLNMGYMTVMPFWYAVGRVWNKFHYKDALLNKDYI